MNNWFEYRWIDLKMIQLIWVCITCDHSHRMGPNAIKKKQFMLVGPGYQSLLASMVKHLYISNYFKFFFNNLIWFLMYKCFWNESKCKFTIFQYFTAVDAAFCPGYLEWWLVDAAFCPGYLEWWLVDAAFCPGYLEWWLDSTLHLVLLILLNSVSVAYIIISVLPRIFRMVVRFYYAFTAVYQVYT